MTFELLEPQSIQEALSLLSAHRDEAKVIAGGQSLLLMIRSGLVRPTVLLSLGSLQGLAEIEVTSEGNLHIGALTTHRKIHGSRLIAERAAILAQAVDRIGSTPVRNFGTIGGNLCHNEMGSDPPPALLVLDAVVECSGPEGSRKIPMSKFFKDYFETCLEPDEILVGIEIPPLPQRSKWLYLKHTIRSGDLAIVGVAVLLEMKDDFCESVKLALGGVGPVPFRILEAEKLLAGSVLDERAIEKASAAAAEATDPITDAHASADYRRKMVRVFVKRAIRQAMDGVSGGEP